MIEADNLIYSRLLVCGDPLPTVRDLQTCHLCRQPVKMHPHDDDCEYWAQWLIFHTLLDLFCLEAIDDLVEIIGEKESLQ